jgi:hypothetical protein
MCGCRGAVPTQQQMTPEELAAEEARVAAVRQSREARRQAHMEKMNIRKLERIKMHGRA